MQVALAREVHDGHAAAAELAAQFVAAQRPRGCRSLYSIVSTQALFLQ